MIIGAQKSATTSLAGQLASHPEVSFCSKKEPGYFQRVEDWKAELSAYHALYHPGAGQICGEASTMYTFLPEWTGTAERLHEYNPELKLIYLMRQPVDRIVSNYAHSLKMGRPAAAPEVEVLQNPSYVNRSRYGMQIRAYLDLFPREQILLLLFEDYVSAPRQTLEQVAAFLHLNPAPFQTIDTSARNASVKPNHAPAPLRAIQQSRWVRRLRAAVPEAASHRLRAWASVHPTVERFAASELPELPEFSAELRRTLWRLLEDDVAVVEKLLGRELAEWRR